MNRHPLPGICADSDAVQVTPDNEGLQLRERDDWRLGFPPSLCPRNAAIIFVLFASRLRLHAVQKLRTSEWNSSPT
jgi:hypothetical protein